MIAIASDHGGLELKRSVALYLDARGIPYKDFGTHSPDSCDYPVYGEAAARAVASGECERGLLFCGTGIGISLAANRVRGIRCAVCSEPYTAQMTRLHNNANMLALGGRVVGPGLAEQIVEIFLRTEYEGGRHERRVALLDEIEP